MMVTILKYSKRKNIKEQFLEAQKMLKELGYKVELEVLLKMYEYHNLDYKVYYKLDDKYYLFAPCGCNNFYISLTNVGGDIIQDMFKVNNSRFVFV